MKLLRTVAEIRGLLEPLRPRSTVGLVPTMGALHDGHVALLRAARRECDVVVATLFVNPAQFGDPSDLVRYPRDERRDERIAADEGADFLFAPSVDEIYPPGYSTRVTVEGPAHGLEGEFRPGHFRGVATVCLKLFAIVRPTLAFFGQKDAQQVAVIRQMVRDLNLELDIRVIATVRDADGLALSSRNARLSPDERARALAIPRALAAGRAAYEKGRDPVAAARAVLAGLDTEYVELRDFDGRPTLAIAARLGATRLIDNEPLGPEPSRGLFKTGLATAFALMAAAAVVVSAQTAVPSGGRNATLTAVPGIKVGHYTLPQRPTGCTVILVEAGATAGVDVRGAAPATRETDLLRPGNLVQIAHAIVLSGGSAFGLDSAGGVMRHLEERRIGFEFGRSHVPIVPAAALFDLSVGDGTIRPTAECGYEAARIASAAPAQEGSRGAGAGATIGKAAGAGRSMKGGIGTAAITLPSGLIVAALVATNGLGDVIDPATGAIVAGARTADGQAFVDARKLLRAGNVRFGAPGQNTTLGVVATNAILTKTEATRIAEMAHDGFARAIAPIHTPVDGDTIFALATGSRAGSADVGQIGALAAEVMADAIVRSVRQATGVAGIPALRDLRK